MIVVPEGRAKQKSNNFPSIWSKPTVFVFSPNPIHLTVPLSVPKVKMVQV
jgi:hypothetical protein